MIHVSSVAALLYAACIGCSTITTATRSSEFHSMSLIGKQFDGFRVWATRDWLDNGSTWTVLDIKLYSNLDCTGTNHNDGTPISSGYATSITDYSPENAFDTDTNSFWYGYNGGFSNNSSEFWIGMEYNSARKVLCLSYLSYGPSNSGNSYGAKKFKIEGREMSSGVWTEIMMVEEPGKRKNITLPVFSSAPSTSPSTSSAPFISSSTSTSTKKSYKSKKKVSKKVKSSKN